MSERADLMPVRWLTKDEMREIYPTPRAQQVERIEALIERVASPTGPHWAVDWGKPGIRKVVS